MTFLFKVNQALNQFLQPLRPSSVAVAVSGGADSLALTYITAAWAKQHHIPFKAVTVDHGLRSESKKEAQTVHEWLSQNGIEHCILTWIGKKPKTRIEEKAREARYALLTDWCHQEHIPVLLLAHHADDQMETFFLRLARQSGLDGLCAMPTVLYRQGIAFVRPMLSIHHRDCIHYLKEKKLSWVEDPMNESSLYERVRLRMIEPILEKEGLTAEAVCGSIQRLQRVRVCLETLTSDFINNHVTKSEAGYVFVPLDFFNSLPDELKIRVLSSLMNWVKGHSPKLQQLEKILPSFPVKMTLGGCQIVPVKKGFYISKEVSKMEVVTVEANRPMNWEGYEVLVSQRVQLGPLKSVLKVEGIPAAVRASFPAFFDEKGLLWVPHLDYKRKKANIKGKIKLKEKKDDK